MSNQTSQTDDGSSRYTQYLQKCNSSNAKLVITYLAMKGKATVDEIATELNFKKINLLPVIDELVNRGFLTRQNNNISIR